MHFYVFHHRFPNSRQGYASLLTFYHWRTLFTFSCFLILCCSLSGKAQPNNLTPTLGYFASSHVVFLHDGPCLFNLVSPWYFPFMTLTRLSPESGTFPGRLAICRWVRSLSFWRVTGVTSTGVSQGDLCRVQARHIRQHLHRFVLTDWQTAIKSTSCLWSIGEYYSISPLKAQVSKDKYLASKSCNEPEVIDSDCLLASSIRSNIGVPNCVGSRLFMFLQNSLNGGWRFCMRWNLVCCTSPPKELYCIWKRAWNNAMLSFSINAKTGILHRNTDSKWQRFADGCWVERCHSCRIERNCLCSVCVIVCSLSGWSKCWNPFFI